MKKYFYMAVAAIAALSSCSSDNDPIMGETGKQALVFTATMEGSEGTRATYNSTNKCAAWEADDQISINGKTYNAQSAGLTTTFKAATEGQEADGPTYNAYFACTYNGETATLPAAVSETWADGKFNMPMYATSNTTSLAFKNLCGVLKITVKSDEIAAVKKIKVSSANKAISGAFTITSDAAELTSPSTIANALTVTYTDAVTTTAEGKVFYVAVPAQTYQELKIELDADGTGFTKSMTTKSAADITVARNKIYPITFADNAPAATTGTAKATIGGQDVDVKWIQLWENGPKFAEYNVGVTDGKAEGYGGYYCWGKATDKDSQGAYKDGTSALTGTDDTATNLWGSNWRMPTNDELQALIDNCDVLWTDNYNGTGKAGRIYTGKGAYASNSVFLPAAGNWYNGNVINQGFNGFYWSSTPRDSGSAYCLDFDSGNQYVDNYDSYYGYSVRAVLKELPPSTGTAKATINGSEVDVNWIQLWENGPKFAEFNVGASSVTETGTTMTFTDAIKAGAEYVWGANWCTPSKEDMDELLKAAATSKGSEKVTCQYCEYTEGDGKWGFKFTGLTDGYTDNSVFFPAQGRGSDYGYAGYWSGTAYVTGAWGMSLGYYGYRLSSWYSYNQGDRFLVRPVLKN